MSAIKTEVKQVSTTALLVCSLPKDQFPVIGEFITNDPTKRCKVLFFNNSYGILLDDNVKWENRVGCYIASDFTIAPAGTEVTIKITNNIY